MRYSDVRACHTPSNNDTTLSTNDAVKVLKGKKTCVVGRRRRVCPHHVVPLGLVNHPPFGDVVRSFEHSFQLL